MMREGRCGIQRIMKNLKIYSYDIVCQEVPDEVTLALNISGCPNRCPGCHSPWLADDVGEEMTGELMRGLIGKYEKAITCVCFMGGDANPQHIEATARWIKEKYPDLKTAWYSGKQVLPKDFDIMSMDYIKVGPYIEKLGGLKSPTTNQVMYRIHPDGTMEKCLF